MLALLIVLVLSAGAGAVAAVGVRHWPQADPARSASDVLKEKLSGWGRIRFFIRSRLDPATASAMINQVEPKVVRTWSA